MLRLQTQIVLLQNYWLPLFVLSLLQCSSSISLGNILTTLLASKSNILIPNKNFDHLFYVIKYKLQLLSFNLFSSTEQLDNNEPNKWLELRRIQTLCYEFDRLNVNNIEYAYLKLISVFNLINNTGNRKKKLSIKI